MDPEWIATGILVVAALAGILRSVVRSRKRPVCEGCLRELERERELGMQQIREMRDARAGQLGKDRE
jgi:heme exporter protein D